MPKAAEAFRNAMISAPGAIAAGVGREVVANKVNPSFAKTKVSNWAWGLDAATIVLAGLGKMVAVTTKSNTLDRASDGLLHAGLGYAAQDLTHLARNHLTKGEVQSQPPQAVAHARTTARRATPVWGGAEY